MESLGECIARADAHLYRVKNALRLPRCPRGVGPRLSATGVDVSPVFDIGHFR